MLGKYLETMTEQQEDRLLTTKMGRYGTRGYPCFLMVAFDSTNAFSVCLHGSHIAEESFRRAQPIRHKLNVAGHYDSLCGRFGDERVNTAIRDRVLTNRLRRLAPLPEVAHV